MGLASHHIKSTSTQNHRHAAIQLLRESLNTYSNPRDGYFMLDTIIILFSLDVSHFHVLGLIQANGVY